ncbi:Heme-binding protein 2 [Dichanthelium oligosanthes]|uniref:Heme-binding protein 2 n=1 Tax=Dichanthelium oligosanthes TaxID=888268 RepID=A0A1E5WKX4_9POAL|nr:Heme-binding protein 2 [Dichanthelium oligosanthes]
MARRSSSLLLVAAAAAAALLAVATAAPVPPTCERIECPAYEVVDSANGFEIRRYTDAMWVSTSPIEDISFVAATRTGFLQLFNYIQGKNAYNETIEMTAPVLTEVSPSDGPFCTSSFVVSFYVPAKNQADPPPAEGLTVRRWAGARYAAVRRFGGFVADSDVGEQAARLDASLQGTRWAAAVNEGRSAGKATSYTVAQYNSPFEFSGRVNEIWMLFDGAKEGSDIKLVV